MENSLIKLLKSAVNKEENIETLAKIFKLYEQLQYSDNIKQIADDLFDWLKKEFNIDNMIFSLFDTQKSSKTIILKKGEDFYFDDDLSFLFIINTHIAINALVSFRATSKVHYQIIKDYNDKLEAAFLQISPIIQSGILKKNYIDSISLDCVTNVYNRKTLLDNLNNHLRLTKNKSKNIFFLMVGIDHFKAIADEFNYDIADNFLIELAKIIRSNISEFDLLGRLNSDEFLITILQDNISNEEINNIANKIITNFENLKILTDPDSKLYLKKTICIGLSVFDNSKNISIDDCIKNADIALYEAKNRGRSQYFKYHNLTEHDTIELF